MKYKHTLHPVSDPNDDDYNPRYDPDSNEYDWLSDPCGVGGWGDGSDIENGLDNED